MLSAVVFSVGLVALGYLSSHIYFVLPNRYGIALVGPTAVVTASLLRNRTSLAIVIGLAVVTTVVSAVRLLGLDRDPADVSHLAAPSSRAAAVGEDAPGVRPDHTAHPTHHRPDIQALRALAVTLVVTYHFWPGRVPGGFVGVDVFFVISGFLITSALLRRAARGTARPRRVLGPPHPAPHPGRRADHRGHPRRRVGLPAHRRVGARRPPRARPRCSTSRTGG